MVEASQQLAEQGYTARLSLGEDGKKLVVEGDDHAYAPQDLRIVAHHRFEGDSNPSDMSIIYVIEGPNELKGTLLDAYGANASADLGAVIRQIPETE